MSESVLGEVWFHFAILIPSIIPRSRYTHFDCERNQEYSQEWLCHECLATREFCVGVAQ
jgi:DNA primase large subunit